MVNYSLGKVYKVEPMSGGEEGDVYIGSTALPRLSTRMAGHRSTYRWWKSGKNVGKLSSYDLFDKYGVTNCQITLIESISAETKEQLLACERKWIQSQTCVNKNVAGRTHNQYYIDNQVSIQQYYLDNREDICRGRRQYYDQNKEKMQQYKKTELAASPTITCVCGSSFKQCYRRKHVKTTKHQRYCQTADEITNI